MIMLRLSYVDHGRLVYVLYFSVAVEPFPNAGLGGHVECVICYQFIHVLTLLFLFPCFYLNKSDIAYECLHVVNLLLLLLLLATPAVPSYSCLCAAASYYALLLLILSFDSIHSGESIYIYQYFYMALRNENGQPLESEEEWLDFFHQCNAIS